MTCAEVRRCLVDYMEGDLDPAIAAQFLAHLESCSQCEAVLNGIQNVAGLLGQISQFEPASGFGNPRLDSWHIRQNR